MYLPIIGAFLEAVGMIFEKKVLKKKNVKYGNYTVYEFFAIVIFSLFILYFFWELDVEALELKNILIFSSVVLFSVLANLLTFYSLKRENVTEFEPIWMLQPLFTVLFAFALYVEERSLIVLFLSIVASATIVIAHVQKNHLKLNKYIVAAFFGSLFFALELVISKLILSYYSPFSFYFLRCLFIFIIVALIYQPNGKELDRSSKFYILIIGIMWVFYRAIVYYGYENVGILYTTLLFTLSSVLMFIFAIIFLKEKPTKRQIISNAVVLVCVIIALLVK